jgi:GntR family transcriptional regulator/MocR family aminotransferase
VTLFIDPDSDQTLTRQLYAQLRDAISEERLKPGDRLVSTRVIATELGVSRSTVTGVYERLRAEGYLEGRAGGGSVVSDIAASNGRTNRAAALRPHPRIAQLRLFDGTPTGRPRFDMRPGVVDASLFPTAAWRRCVRLAADRGNQHYGDPSGSPELRAVLARWLMRSRGVSADPGQLMVTSGSGHAIDLTARVLLQPGDLVCVEEPGYIAVSNLLRAQGLNVVGAPVDSAGIVVDAIPVRARAVYVTPSHQYPLGVVMSRARRHQLLRWAEQHDAAVIEDDYDTEFRRTSRPLEPLQLLDNGGRVIYVGTFSKSLSPGLRLGFLVAPGSLIPSLRAVRQAIDWSPPGVIEVALTHFIAEGHLDRHLRRARIAYRTRHKHAWQALTQLLPAGYQALPSDTGLHITITGPATPPDDVLHDAAQRKGIFVGRLRLAYQFTPPVGGLIIGYGGIHEDQARTAIRVLVRDVLGASS